MTEHEQLKYICDKIWYEIKYKFDRTYYEQVADTEYRTIDVREIIFTQEFMDKYWEYYKEYKFSSSSIYQTMQLELLNNLDNPVQYLYELIK